jgi:hypothetical protein
MQHNSKEGPLIQAKSEKRFWVTKKAMKIMKLEQAIGLTHEVEEIIITNENVYQY